MTKKAIVAFILACILALIIAALICSAADNAASRMEHISSTELVPEDGRGGIYT